MNGILITYASKLDEYQKYIIHSHRGGIILSSVGKTDNETLIIFNSNMEYQFKRSLCSHISSLTETHEYRLRYKVNIIWRPLIHICY